MKKKGKVLIIDLFADYGRYVCNVGRAMDKAGISVSKMRKLTGLNHEIVKKYYEDKVVRMDKDVLARITYILSIYGIKMEDLIEYIPPKGDY